MSYYEHSTHAMAMPSLSVYRVLIPVLALLVVVAPPAVAQSPIPVTEILDHPAGVHVVTLGPNGAECHQAEEQVMARRMGNAPASSVRRTAVTSTNPSGTTRFKIILRATDQLLAQPEALLSFRRAAAQWERIIQSDVTTVIDVDYGPTRFGTPYPSANTLGSTGSALRFTIFDPSSYIQRLVSQTSDDQLIELYRAVPLPTPSTLQSDEGPVTLGTMIAGTIPLQIYGAFPAQLQETTTESVPNIGFNSSFSFDFDPRDGIGRSQIDFEGVAIHEIGHALGFVSAIGIATPSNRAFAPWDLFRVRPDAVTANEKLNDGVGWEVAPRVVTPGPVETEVVQTIEGVQFFAAVQVFFDGLKLLETSTSTGLGEGGDGFQASHWRDDRRRSPEFGPQRKIGIMDPNSGFGELDEITENDIRMLEVIGYDVNYAPPSADARYALNGADLDTETTLVFGRDFFLGKLEVGQTGTATVSIRNVDPATVLDYEVEFVRGEVASGGNANISVTLDNALGTLAPEQTATVTVSFSAQAPALVFGTLLLRSNDSSQYVVSLPVAFSVGDASFASLKAAPITLEAGLNTQKPIQIEARNPSTVAELEYLRILEPALSNGPPLNVTATDADPAAPEARHGTETLDVAARSEPASGTAAGGPSARRAQASAALPGATFPFAITELGDGRLLISDLDLSSGAATRTLGLYLVSADLATVTKLPSPISADYLSGLAYDSNTDKVWIAEFSGRRMRETTFSESGLTLTGVDVPLGFIPTSLSYSAELDAFVVTPNASDQVYIVDRAGTPLPRYPITVPPVAAGAARNSIVSQSFREGVLEISGFQNELRQYDQFGRDFEGSSRVVFADRGPELMGARRYLAYVRSRVDYDAKAYYVLDRADATSNFFVVSVDPPDFPARVGTSLNAANAKAASGTAPAQATFTLDYILDTRGRQAGFANETLAFLVNNPPDPIVRIPFNLAVAGEDGVAGGTFTVVGAVPNPVRDRGVVRLTLATAAEVTVTVFNVLGQQVAVLAQDSPLTAGTHDLSLTAGELASGTYIVRVRAGDEVATQKLTVVR